MKFKNIHFIINPASGKEEPILNYISQAFADSNINWDLSLTKKGHSAAELAKKLIDKTDLVIVYGGDGCVTEVATALHGSCTPMAILPGGTANVMAKELDIPQDSRDALELLKDGNHQIKNIDMGTVNGKPFLLRVNMGIMADMILTADRKLKETVGQMAYGVTAVKTIAAAEEVSYKMIIDGKTIEETGVSLTITNSGNIGVGDLSMQPGISVTDGLLDIILLKDTDLSSLLKVAGSTLLRQKTDALMHWRCKEVVISTKKAQQYIRDDCEETAKKLTIKMVPASIKILVPAEK